MMPQVMKAVAVRFPKGQPDQNPIPNSVEVLNDVPVPEITHGHQVLVKVLGVGLDATDEEINEGKYGRAPEDCDYLILGHEVFGQVINVGEAVKHVQPGDYVACTVRRNGNSKHDQIGRNDLTSDEKYFERGIAYRHGYLTEYFVDDAEYIVKMPNSIRHLHILAEPSSVVAKGLEEAYAAQRRLQVWKPKVAFVLGAGQIGLLATLMLKLRGVEVYTLARTLPGPTCLKGNIVHQLGGQYVSTQNESMVKLTERVGKPDLIFEATGSAEIAFRAMEVLNLNGILIWSSITGGAKLIDALPADKINLQWVLGNKTLIGTVNGNAEHFRIGIQALVMGNELFPGILQQMLTHRVDGLDQVPHAIANLLSASNPPLKVYVSVNGGLS